MDRTEPTAPADAPSDPATADSGEANRSLGAFVHALRESSLVGVFRADPSGALREGNGTLARMLGLSSADSLIAREEGLPWRDSTTWPALIDRLRRKGRSGILETELRVGDEGHCSVLVDSRLESGSVVGLVVEITERRRAQRVLKRTEDANRGLLAAIPDLMIRFDERGQCLDYHPPLGSEPDEPVSSYVGRSVNQMFPEALAFQFTHHIEQALQTRALQTYDYQLLDGDSLQDYEARIAVSGQSEVLVLVRDITMRKRAEIERERLLSELQDALRNVRRLSGLLPICSSCKSIRDDKGYWKKVEEYVHEHSEADFTHSLCPECVERLYPGFAEKRLATEAKQALDDPPGAPESGAE